MSGRNVDASKKNLFVATEIIVLDFEFFIGGRRDGRFTVTSAYKAQLVKAYLLADLKTVVDGSVTTEGDQTTFSLKFPVAASDLIASVMCMDVKP